MLTMTSALDRAERQYGLRLAITDAEGDFTWGQHVDRVRRAAGMLASGPLLPSTRRGSSNRCDTSVRRSFGSPIYKSTDQQLRPSRKKEGGRE